MPSIKRQPSLTTSCCASHCKGVYVFFFLKTLLRMNDTDTRKKNSKTVIGSLTKRQIWNIQSRLQMIGVGRCFANSFRQLQGGSRVWSSHRLNTSTIMHTETRLYMQETERQRQTNTVTHTHRGACFSHTLPGNWLCLQATAADVSPLNQRSMILEYSDSSNEQSIPYWKGLWTKATHLFFKN